MIRQIPKKTGFTLIELLVVISIIGLLASVIFAALSSARGKAKDAALISEVGELQKIAEQVASDTGSYAQAQPSWHLPDVPANGGPHTCAQAGGGGNYAAQWQGICNAILNNSTGAPNEWDFLAGNQPGTGQVYSFTVWLPYQKMYYCLGSSGSSITSGGNGVGCWNNP